MGHRLFKSLIAMSCVLSSAAACNALTGADALETKGVTSSTSSSGSTTSSGSNSSGSAGASGQPGQPDQPGQPGDSGDPGPGVVDGGPTSTDAGPPAGSTMVLNETFDSACGNAWVASNGTLTADANGGCMLCATTAEASAYVETTVSAPPIAGLATMEAWVKRKPAASSPGGASVTLKIGGVTVSNGTSISESYKKLSSGKASVQAGASIAPRVGINTPAVGDCIVIDAIRVFIAE